MAATDVLEKISTNVNRLGQENGQFRQLAAQQNSSIGKFMKDVGRIFSNQSMQQSSMNNSLNSMEQSITQSSQKVDTTNSLLGQSLSLQTNMLQELKNISASFQQMFEGQEGGAQGTVNNILKSVGLMAGSAAAGGAIGAGAGAIMNSGGSNIGELPQLQSLDQGKARENAESYLGRKMSDQEYDYLVRATHAEAAAGKNADPREQAMIMASILNRARDMGENGVIKALTAKNQFQSVTGTANAPGPSPNFTQGPGTERQQSIENSSQLLQSVPQSQKNFTAASSAAYGPGTNIGYRNDMLSNGGTIVGGSVFNTNPDFNSAQPQQTNTNNTQGNQVQSSGGGQEGGLTTVRTKSGKTAQVNAAYAENFQGFINDLEATGYEIKNLGGFADRDNRNNPGQKSYHAMGAAIDINPEQNPNGSTQTDLPPQTRELAAKWGLGWGMDFKKTKDPMHFSAAKAEHGAFDIARGSISGQSSGSSGGTSGGGVAMGSDGIAPSGSMMGGMSPMGIGGGGDIGGIIGSMFGGSPLGMFGSLLGSVISSGIGGARNMVDASEQITPKQTPQIETAQKEPEAVKKIQTAALETDALKFNQPQQQQHQEPAMLPNPSNAHRPNDDMNRGGYPSQSAFSSSPSWYMQLAGRIHYDDALKFKGGVLA